MTALSESVRFGIEKQRQHAIEALKKDDLAAFAEILGELRTAQLSAEHSIADLQERFNDHRALQHMEGEGAHAHPDAVPA